MQLQQTLVTLEIAGTACRLHCDDDAFTARLGERYAAFGATTAPQLSVDVMLTEHPTLDVVTAWSGPYARVTGDDRGLVVEGLGFTGRFDEARAHAVITQPPDPEPLETLLTAVYASRLLSRGGFFLHAATIVGRAGALVFFGPSGSGKTTVTELVGDGVLTDEITVIHRVGGEYLVSSVPWRGRAQTAPLAGLFRLRQATQTSVTRLSAPDTIRHLLSSVFFSRADARELGQFLEAAEAVTCAVPAYELAFTRDRAFWAAVPGAA